MAKDPKQHTAKELPPLPPEPVTAAKPKAKVDVALPVVPIKESASASKDTAVTAATVSNQPEVTKVTTTTTTPAPVSEKPRGRGCRPSCSCQTITCGSCLLFILFVLVLGFLIWQRPAIIVNPLKEWSNGDVQPIQYQDTTADSVLNEVAYQIDTLGVGLNTLTFNESQIKALLDNSYPSFDNSGVNVDLEPQLIRIFWDLDRGPGIPLWAVVEISVDELGVIKFHKIGTPSLALPGFLNQALTQAAASVLNISGGELNAKTLTQTILPFDSGVQVEKLVVGDDQLTITVNLTTGLEDFLN